MAKQTVRKAISVLAFTIILAAGFITPAHAAWSLVWADEFNGTSLNTANWSYSTGTGCPSLCGWGNNELQYYRSQNVAVAGGNLVITAKAESFNGSSFTSGKIHTKGKHSFLYGRVEMRAKIPTGGGMWPAFWMMPEADVYGGWAASGEIDIMEAANATTSVGGTIHYGGTWPNNTSSGGSYSLGGANFADTFHVYAIEWEADAMRWYVDGVLYSTKTSAQWFSSGAPGNPRAPFDQAFHIILNAAVGGNYTGCTSPGCISATLPQQFLVDYVRVYADIVNVPPNVTITSPGAGGVLPAGNITINATASDPDGSIAKVEFYDGSTWLGEDTTAPYSFVWNSVADGCYDIVARALDNLGGVATDQVDITVGAGCGQAPYLGSPFVLPARIEAEDYDSGGEGVAYRDADPGNNGAQYRTTEGVDIELCTDAGGGFNVGWLNPGEYLEYTVDVPAAGDYTFDTRAASLSAGGAFRLEFNGSDRTGNVAVPVTGGWQTWTTVQASATLDAGTQIMRFVPTSAGFNLNYFNATLVPSAVLPDGPKPHALYAAHPNPFNRSTTISYELRDRVTVSLAIFDVRGRLVRTLVGGEALAAGRHEASWNGRDETGQHVATGVYFYRLNAGRYTEMRRVVLAE